MTCHAQSNVVHDRYQGNQVYDGIKSTSICKLHGLSLRIRYQFDMMMVSQEID